MLTNPQVLSVVYEVLRSRLVVSYWLPLEMLE